MTKKKIYITPTVCFEEIEQQTALCDISGYGPDEHEGSGSDHDRPIQAKSSFWDDDFAAPTEDTTSDFVFNNESNW